MTLLQTLEQRVASHGEGVLSPEDLAELVRLRSADDATEEVAPEEEFEEEFEEEEIEDAD